MKVYLLLWTPWESLRDSQGTTNHTLKTMALPDSLVRFFFLSEVDLFNRGRYEESFVKDCRTVQGRSKNGEEFFQ